MERHYAKDHNGAIRRFDPYTGKAVPRIRLSKKERLILRRELNKPTHKEQSKE